MENGFKNLPWFCLGKEVGFVVGGRLCSVGIFNFARVLFRVRGGLVAECRLLSVGGVENGKL